ncbi:MAG: hypothetical protein MUF87_17960 [Anaerolineae bacterium]|nr:hypothetical protein [Anaerolineae bacterium]
MSLAQSLTLASQLHQMSLHLLDQLEWSTRARADLQAVQRNAQRLERSLSRAIQEQIIPEYDQWVHELRNPLNVVIGYTEIWLEAEQGLSDDQQRELRALHHDAMQLAELIATHLDS